MMGVARVEDGRFKFFSGLELITEIEGIEAPGNAHLIELVLFDGDAPGAAPGQRAEPDFAVLFVRIVLADGKPWIELMACRSAAAFQHALALMDGFLIERPLAGPAAAQV